MTDDHCVLFAMSAVSATSLITLVADAKKYKRRPRRKHSLGNIVKMWICCTACTTNRIVEFELWQLKCNLLPSFISQNIIGESYKNLGYTA